MPGFGDFVRWSMYCKKNACVFVKSVFRFCGAEANNVMLKTCPARVFGGGGGYRNDTCVPYFVKHVKVACRALFCNVSFCLNFVRVFCEWVSSS